MLRPAQWDIFCKVIDNFGDIGVCWRLATDLARRGQQVRLWIDDSSALAFMAPDGCDGVQVLPWAEPFDLSVADLEAAPCEILIEAFGCEIAPEFIAACARIHWARGKKPLWIDLEYLSAEPYVVRSHGLASPIQFGAAAGWTKRFFYPGFTPQTGGLLREPDLPERQRKFDRATWLSKQGIAWRGEKLVSLFCYEPAGLPVWLAQLAASGLNGEPVKLLVTAGRATEAVKAVFEHQKGILPNEYGCEMLSISYLPLLRQDAFDELLWAADMNFVRGEDSLVRAIWAGRPFVWQAYPQTGSAHLAKLEALLDEIDAPSSLRQFHTAWNGPDAVSGTLPEVELETWVTCAEQARHKLLAQDDLCTKLLAFCIGPPDAATPSFESRSRS